MNKEIELTEGQSKVLNDLEKFLNSRDRVFMLKGYAGTGKTTLMKFLIEHLKKEKNFITFLLLLVEQAKYLLTTPMLILRLFMA